MSNPPTTRHLGQFLSRHLLDGKVRALPLRKPVSVTSDTKLSKIVGCLQQHRIGSVAVTSHSGELLGIVTERDLLRKVGLDSPAFETLSAQDVMTENPDTLPAHASIARVLFTMANGHFRHVPVVDSNGALISVLSSKDVVDFLYKNLAKKVVENRIINEFSVDSATAEFFGSSVKSLSPFKAATISHKFSLSKTIEKLRKEDIGGLAILGQDQKLEGIFTERDYINKVILKFETPDSETIDRYMTAKPTTILEYSTCSLAFDLLSHGGFRHLPVVNDDADVLGMISVRNFIDALSKDVMEDLATPAQP